MFKPKLIKRADTPVVSNESDLLVLSGENSIALNAAIAGSDKVEAMTDYVDQSESILTMLEKQRNSLLESAKGEGITRLTAESVQATIDYAVDVIGFDPDESYMPNVSDFDNESDRAELTRLTGEGFSDMVKKGWEALRDFVVGIFKAIVAWFSKIFGSSSAEALAKQHKALKEKIKKANGTPVDSELDNTSLAKTFTGMTSGKADLSDINEIILSAGSWVSGSMTIVDGQKVIAEEIDGITTKKKIDVSKVLISCDRLTKAATKTIKESPLATNGGGGNDKGLLRTFFNKVLPRKSDTPSNPKLKDNYVAPLTGNRRIRFVSIMENESDKVVTSFGVKIEDNDKSPAKKIHAGTIGDMETVSDSIGSIIAQFKSAEKIGKKLEDNGKKLEKAIDKIIKNMDDATDKEGMRIIKSVMNITTKGVNKLVSSSQAELPKTIKGGFNWIDASLSNLKE